MSAFVEDAAGAVATSMSSGRWHDRWTSRRPGEALWWTAPYGISGIPSDGSPRRSQPTRRASGSAIPTATWVR